MLNVKVREQNFMHRVNTLTYMWISGDTKSFYSNSKSPGNSILVTLKRWYNKKYKTMIVISNLDWLWQPSLQRDHCHFQQSEYQRAFSLFPRLQNHRGWDDQLGLDHKQTVCDSEELQQAMKNKSLK